MARDASASSTDLGLPFTFATLAALMGLLTVSSGSASLSLLVSEGGPLFCLMGEGIKLFFARGSKFCLVLQDSNRSPHPTKLL